MEARFPHPRPKGSHHQFHNQRQQQPRYMNPQYIRAPVPSHLPINNYEDSYHQNAQLMIQTQPDWQPPYQTTSPDHYVSPTCGSPVPQNAPAIYAQPLPPPAVYNPPPMADGNNTLSNPIYPNQQQVYATGATGVQQYSCYDYFCSYCRGLNVYWKLVHEEKNALLMRRNTEIAQLKAKIERLQDALAKVLPHHLEITNNNISADAKDSERPINHSQLSVDAPEFTFSQNDPVPVVSANGDLTEGPNYRVEEPIFRVESSNHTSFEDISCVTEEEYSGNSPELKSDSTNEVKDIDNCNTSQVDTDPEINSDAAELVLQEEAVETDTVKIEVDQLSSEVKKEEDLDKEVNMDNRHAGTNNPSSSYKTFSQQQPKKTDQTNPSHRDNTLPQQQHNRTDQSNAWNKGSPISSQKGVIHLPQPNKTYLNKNFQSKGSNQGTKQYSYSEKQRKTSESLSRKNSDDGSTSYTITRREMKSPDIAKNVSHEVVSSERMESQTHDRDEASSSLSDTNFNPERFGNRKKNFGPNRNPKRNQRGRYDEGPQEPDVSSHMEFPPMGAGSAEGSEAKQVEQTRWRNEHPTPSTSKRSRSNSRSKEGAQSSYNQSNDYSSGNNYRGSGGYRKNDQERYQKNRKEIVTEITGDLFSAPDHFSLAHCVGSDFKMGSGIAVAFKQNFKRVSELLDQGAKVGEVAFIKEKERYIFYLVTKKLSTGKPTYQDFIKTLNDLMAKCVEYEVKHLAIPRIGCGLDRLDWKIVKNHIRDVFEGSNTEITVYNFEDNLQEKDYKPNQEKDKKGPLGKEKKPSQPQRSGPYVVKSDKPLVEIVCQTALVFFGTEDGHVDRTAESLDKKFHFVPDYKSDPTRVVGEVVRFQRNNEVMYGLIVRKTVTDKFSFSVFETCLRKLNKLLARDEFHYIGFEAFNDPDDVLMAKILTVLRSTIRSQMELWFCFPEDVVDIEKESGKRPQNTYSS